jgi:molybdopterin adenylyltransferase
MANLDNSETAATEPASDLISVGIITVSDKSSRGEREDEGGPAIREIVLAGGAAVGAYAIVPDEQDEVAAQIRSMADERQFDVVLTTGGTGLSPRDVTPQATLSVIDYEVPGLAEVMRAESFKKTPAAALSRAVAGVRGRTLVVNLPGNPKGVRECLEVIMPVLPHAVGTVRGEVGEHSRPAS